MSRLDKVTACIDSDAGEGKPIVGIVMNIEARTYIVVREPSAGLNVGNLPAEHWASILNLKYPNIYLGKRNFHTNLRKLKEALCQD